MKKIIRLTESDLRNIINASVRKCINESFSQDYSNQKVDVLELFSNGALEDEYGELDEEGNDPIEGILDEYIPVALVHIESHEEEAEMDFYGPKATGYPGGKIIDDVYIDEDDANIIRQLEQNGQIPQGMADDLIAAIEKQGEEQEYY